MLAQRGIPRYRHCLDQLLRCRRIAKPPCYMHRLHSSEAACASSSSPIPQPSLVMQAKTYPDKIKKIVEDISLLTLLETSQLNDLLKSTLNIPDAPVMAMSPAAPSMEAEEEATQEVQTSFTVKLVKYADDSKIKLIKEVKALTEGMNLVQAKKFVESLPQEMKTNVNKDEAKKLSAALEAAGGIVEIV